VCYPEYIFYFERGYPALTNIFLAENHAGDTGTEKKTLLFYKRASMENSIQEQ